MDLFQVVNKILDNLDFCLNAISEIISGLAEKAFSAGLASAEDFLVVWMSFIEYLVRKCKWDDGELVSQVREAFTRAIEHLTQSKLFI